MALMRERVYISGPLHAAEDVAGARKYYESVAAVCREQGLQPYLPHMHNDSTVDSSLTPEAIYEQDMQYLLGSSLVIAHVGAPSSGVGAELAIAVHHNIPVLAIWRPNEQVSRFLLGLLRAAGAYELSLIHISEPTRPY